MQRLLERFFMKHIKRVLPILLALIIALQISIFYISAESMESTTDMLKGADIFPDNSSFNKSTDINFSIYEDCDKISTWAKSDVKQAYERKLMSGSISKDGKRYFNPEGTVTLGEAFSMVLNFLNNNDLDVKSNMLAYGIPPLNLVSNTANALNSYMLCEAEYVKKYGSYSSWDKIKSLTGCTNPITLGIIGYYNYKRAWPEEPDIPLYGWEGHTLFELGQWNYDKLTPKQQIKKIIDIDIQRTKEQNNSDVIYSFTRVVLFDDYLSRAGYSEKFKTYQERIRNNLDEKLYAQNLINAYLFPNMQTPNHWAWKNYQDVIKYMYLDGNIMERDISLSTPLRKDQFASLMYWVLAVSMHTRDWSGEDPTFCGNYLELSRTGFKQFKNLPTDPFYFYGMPLNQLKELGIIEGVGNDTVDYSSIITREQAATILNKVYNTIIDHDSMIRYNCIDGAGRYYLVKWYDASPNFTKNIDELSKWGLIGLHWFASNQNGLYTSGKYPIEKVMGSDDDNYYGKGTRIYNDKETYDIKNSIY